MLYRILFVSSGLFTLRPLSDVFIFLLGTETEQGVAQAIIRSVIDFKRDPWPRVSDSAKDLVRKMLEPDPKKRLTAAQVLGRLLFSARLSFLKS